MSIITSKAGIAAQLALACSAVCMANAAHAAAQERVIKIAGFGAMSGTLRQFGVNSEAAMLAAADQINAAGGVTLGDGAKAKIAIEFKDDRCNPDEGIAVLRRIAATDALAVIGSTCSSVTETAFGVLQKKVGNTADSGLQIPVFADVAMKLGLARISDWSFRNIPDEVGMYDSLFSWIKSKYPDAKTIYGGVEEDFIHSRQTWYSVMKEKAQAAGYDAKGESKWLLTDTSFSGQVREMKAVNADVVAISAHPATACGVLKEMQRQGVHPKVLIGLTSISSPETLEICGKQAEGLIIPTSYAPVNAPARAAATATARFHGYADLHSMAAWENMFIIKRAIESEGVMATPDSVQSDRAKIRAGLAKLTQTEGLLGTLKRTPERESIKPYVFVQAKKDAWQVIHTPPQ
jgi:branched-chain amino acid transport system substrate-binding protein